MRGLIALGLLLLLCQALFGCGGGSASNGTPSQGAATGRATFTIHWPARSRLIPDASNGIRVTVNDGAVQVAQQLLPRPRGLTSTATFDALPVGDLSVTATAFPHADGSGVAQATATIPLVIEANKTTNFSLTMASTINTLVLTAPKQVVVVGSTIQFRVSGRDLAGNVVLLSPAKLSWASSNAAKANVDASGLVLGVAVGNASITVTDTESGKKATLPLTVKAVSTISFKPPVIYNVSCNSEVIARDFDGDGKLDLVFGNDAGLQIMYGNGDGTFGSAQLALSWNGGINPVASADMNGDGRPDVVCTASSQVLVVHNRGNRTFSPPIAIPVPNLITVCTGDFNGDGKQDLAIDVGEPGSTSTDVFIYRNNGGGNFTQISSFRDIWIMIYMRAADVDGDGKTDLVTSIVTDIGGTSGVHVYWGDGAGNFAGGPSIGTGSFNVGPTTTADFNSDGKQDIAISDITDGGVGVILNAGGRNFQNPAHYGGPDGPVHIESPDLDGDGQPDLVVRGGTRFTALHNQNGLFPTFVKVESGANTIGMTVGDFNRDGKPDVALTTDQGISVLLNSTR